MPFPSPDPEHAAALLRGRGDVDGLLAEARRLRDEGKGRTVTYSRKVFVPLTTLCRDRCTYCTFAKPPGAGGAYLEPGDVLAIAAAGEAAGCTEALFTLGDRPEDRWPAAREFLEAKGLASTMDYVAETTAMVAEETSLFPHANPGVMTGADLARLRPSNLSMGLMLENVSPRLTEPGMPHHGSPDKEPEVRLATIAAAAEHRVPFTTGVLIGIGETPEEVADSLFAIAAMPAVQEVIVQNFRAKADTRMRREPEPTVQYTARVAAAARWILGPDANVQVPPNLTERYEAYLDAGINDWGGVSPLTIDWVNPEAPWPHLEELEARTAAAGFTLAPRLPAYPEYLTPEWVDEGLLPKARAAVDARGHAVAPREAA
ncbi:MAG: 7,8-didemethyl-8-hydroxy-5-deazariboflavin synthase CofG [Actinobacteria bacterium]|nr:7,8-didemethyl-8-hydroxy-5-deazariboflavin synthase CofG [Actinomycetota bacterium]